jgi:hypothetical protein
MGIEKPNQGGKHMAEKGVLIKVHGMYYFKNDREKGTKSYVREIKAPSLEFFRETYRKYTGTDDNGNPKYKENSYLNVRGQLKRRILPLILPKTITDFARVKYVVIDEIVSLDGAVLDLPVDLCSLDQLAKFITAHDIPVKPDEYIDIDDLRADINAYQESPETFMADKPRKDKLRAEEKEFIAMNSLNETLPPRASKKPGIADL